MHAGVAGPGDVSGVHDGCRAAGQYVEPVGLAGEHARDAGDGTTGQVGDVATRFQVNAGRFRPSGGDAAGIDDGLECVRGAGVAENSGVPGDRPAQLIRDDRTRDVRVNDVELDPGDSGAGQLDSPVINDIRTAGRLDPHAAAADHTAALVGQRITGVNGNAP